MFCTNYLQHELKEDNALKAINRLSSELAELKEQKTECVDELDREKLIVLEQSNFINQLKVDMHAASKHHQSRNVKDANEKVIQVIRMYTITTCKHQLVVNETRILRGILYSQNGVISNYTRVVSVQKCVCVYHRLVRLK